MKRKKKPMKTRGLLAAGLVALMMALVPTTASAAVAPPTPANNSLLINALVGGVFSVQFRCAPGTVTGANPGVITLIDNASPFDTTAITDPAPVVGDTTVPNACSNSINANFSQIDVTTTGSDGVGTVPAGGATTLGGLTQSAAVPSAVFVAGYNIGLLTVGVNNIPANVQTKIEATSTVQGVQTTNIEGGTPPDGSVLVTTTITDPDGTSGTGDESASPGAFSVGHDDLSWTAGTSGAISYRQASIVPVPVVDAPAPAPPATKKKCKKGFKLKTIKKKGKKKKCVRVKKKKKKK